MKFAMMTKNVLRKRLGDIVTFINVKDCQLTQYCNVQTYNCIWQVAIHDKLFF